MVAAGEAPDDEAKADVDEGTVSGGAESGGADKGGTTGGEKMALLLSRLALAEPPALVVAEGEDWLFEHHFHSGCFLK